MKTNYKITYDPFEKLSDKLIRQILVYLNVVQQYINKFDVCRSTRVNRRWHEIIDKDPLMFEYINLEYIDTNKPLFPILKVFSRDKMIKHIALPSHATQTDTAYMIMQLPLTIESLKLININMEFSKIFTRVFSNMNQLILVNSKNRRKPFDEIEMKSFLTLKSIQILQLTSLPFENSLIPYFQEFNLKELCINETPQLNNQSLHLIEKHCKNLITLKIGGSPQLWNQNITKSGFMIELPNLKTLEIHYCSKIGDEAMNIIAQNLPNLQSLSIVRNHFEQSAKISDKGFKNIGKLNLQSLSIIYTRKLKEEAHIYISAFSNLQYLCLSNCPLNCDVSIWNIKCPLLQELNASGDSWVSQPFVLAVAAHPNLKIFWLGHFEHGDQDCDTKLQQYPPEGLFLESVFKKNQNFKNLHTLHLERDCNLTYWLYGRLSKLRPQIFFK